MRGTLNAGASATLAAHVAPVRDTSGTNWETARENNRLVERGTSYRSRLATYIANRQRGDER